MLEADEQFRLSNYSVGYYGWFNDKEVDAFAIKGFHVANRKIVGFCQTEYASQVQSISLVI